MSVTAADLSQDISFGSKYTHEQRIEVVGTYLVYGNLNKVAELLNIPRRTLTDWKNTDWWQELITKVRQQKEDEIDSTLTRITTRAAQAIENKLENEDDYSIVDAAKVYGIMFDKQRLLRNQPTSITSGVTNDQLLDLKAQFEKLAGKTIEGERVE